MCTRHIGTMFIFRRHRPGPGAAQRRPSPTSIDPRLVPVFVSADVLEEFPQLAQALADGSVILVDDPDACAVSVVGPVGPVGVAFLTMAHRRPALLVVGYAGADASTAAACVAAGAAGYLERPSVKQLVSSIRSLASRPSVDALVS